MLGDGAPARVSHAVTPVERVLLEQTDAGADRSLVPEGAGRRTTIALLSPVLSETVQSVSASG